jgi:hypothetical protein
MAIGGAHSRRFLLAFLLGRLVKRYPTPLGWLVIGSNLGLGLLALRWLARQQPAPTARGVPKVRVQWLREHRPVRSLAEPS